MTETTTPAVKLTRGERLAKLATTLAARIEADTAKYNEIVTELNNAAALNSVTVGSEITVKLGRKFSAEKDTTKYVIATVFGVKELEDGTVQYKVQYGEGFDAEIAVIRASQITDVAEGGSYAVGAAPVEGQAE